MFDVVLNTNKTTRRISLLGRLDSFVFLLSQRFLFLFKVIPHLYDFLLQLAYQFTLFLPLCFQRPVKFEILIRTSRTRLKISVYFLMITVQSNLFNTDTKRADLIHIMEVAVL